MFRRWGKCFAQGAKDEILKESTIDWEAVIDGCAKLLEVGLFVLALVGGTGKPSSNPCSTVIVNNYIQGGK